MTEGLRGLVRRLRRLGDRLRLPRRTTRLEMLLLEHPALRDPAPIAAPMVTVIMPSWNRAPLVGAAIRSVQAQTFTDWELIVVDDGSTDDTAAVMESFAGDPRIRHVVQPHAGQCAARNNALRQARGALIAYLDSDNVWYPGFLAAAVPVFHAEPGVDCLYGAMRTDSHLVWDTLLFEPFSRARLERGNFIGMSTFMHRRSLFERLGGFDEALTCLEDWDLVLRYTAHAPAFRLPALAVRYRSMDGKRLSVTERHHRARDHIRRKLAAAR